jgi:hypothetical protein
LKWVKRVEKVPKCFVFFGSKLLYFVYILNLYQSKRPQFLQNLAQFDTTKFFYFLLVRVKNCLSFSGVVTYKIVTDSVGESENFQDVLTLNATSEAIEESLGEDANVVEITSEGTIAEYEVTVETTGVTVSLEEANSSIDEALGEDYNVQPASK